MGMRLAVIGGACILLAAPAVAQSPEIVVQGTNLKMGYATATGQVPFGDLNLKTQSGVDTLNARVKAEAQKLCATGGGSAPVRGDTSACVNSMVASAQPQVDQVVARARM
jgi:UrcA family protein